MNTYQTPFGHIEVLKNGTPIPFELGPGGFQSCPQASGENNKPEGQVEIAVDLTGMKLRDSVVVQFSGGALDQTGGDEGTISCTGVAREYAIALGAVDTGQVEGWHMADLSAERAAGRQRWLPYMYVGLEGSGAEFWIVDDPALYQDPALEPYRGTIYVAAAWMKSDDPAAMDILSEVTSFWMPAGSFGEDE